MKFQAKVWDGSSAIEIEAIYLAFQPISPRVLSAAQRAFIPDSTARQFETQLVSNREFENKMVKTLCSHLTFTCKGVKALLLNLEY